MLLDGLKQLSAAIATSGSVALYHIVGITPEARSEELAFGGKRIRKSEYMSSAKKTDGIHWPNFYSSQEADLIIFGCPHTSITELQTIARYLEGRSWHTEPICGRSLQE